MEKAERRIDPALEFGPRVRCVKIGTKECKE